MEIPEGQIKLATTCSARFLAFSRMNPMRYASAYQKLDLVEFAGGVTGF
jgi:hypothetical protein